MKITDEMTAELRQSASMIREWAPETFPANEQGQVHFARAIMESVAETIEKALTAAPASAAEPQTATITFTRAMGIYGKACDLPGPHRAYTYEHQPDNQSAYRLGKIAAMPPEGGDHIDYGLYLLRAMQESGFGVFEIEPLYLHPTPAVPAQGAVKVKALEWDDLESETCFGFKYRVYEEPGVARICYAVNLVDGRFETVEDARAAAQADYEQRILSAIHSPAHSGLRDRVPDLPSDDEIQKLAASVGAKFVPHERAPAHNGEREFKPCVIHYEDGDYSRMLLADCPTVTNYPPVVVDALYDLNDWERIVGFQWHGKCPSPAHSGEREAWPAGAKFKMGALVRKHSGSWWEGAVVGWYSTAQTPIGYCIQIDTMSNGPVQIFPEAALEPMP